jgi:hypothetical protein
MPSPVTGAGRRSASAAGRNDVHVELYNVREEIIGVLISPQVIGADCTQLGRKLRLEGVND